MRRAEIDLIEWRMMDWQKQVIRLKQTEWLHLKTHDAPARSTLDPELVRELRELMPASQSSFIITSDGRRAMTRLGPTTAANLSLTVSTNGCGRRA